MIVLFSNGDLTDNIIYLKVNFLNNMEFLKKEFFKKHGIF